MPGTLYPGDHIQVTALWTEATGVSAVDPDVVTFTLVSPDGIEAVYPDSADEVTHPGAGTFVADLTLTAPGHWRIIASGAGTIDKTEVVTVTVEPLIALRR